jgi:hypothetical protein
MDTVGITQYIVIELIAFEAHLPNTDIFVSEFFIFFENIKNNYFWASHNLTCFAWHIAP